MKEKSVILLVILHCVICTTYTVVDTPNGAIRGVVEDGVRKFRSIPYAQAPVGNLRWSPPVPVSG